MQFMQFYTLCNNAMQSELSDNLGNCRALGGVGYYVKYTQDRFFDQLNGQNERHEKEMATVTAALNNNTEAIRANEKTLALLTQQIMNEKAWDS